ncbi:hypothetical protein J7K55_07420 [Candidatus Aerophobetes bacterium]|nr:hypothetical protein [Candidatus Aerophobetes bacterium]
MARVVVDAGICGFTTIIEVSKLSVQRVSVTIASNCEMVNKWGKQLDSVHWQNVLKFPGIFLFYQSAFQYIRHVTCPVPIAILEAIEVEVGIALPKDVIFRFETIKNK